MRQSRTPTEWMHTYRIAPEDVRLRVMAEFGGAYLGRSLLLGVTRTGPGRIYRSQEQFIGTIVRIDLDGIAIQCEPDGPEIGFPPDLSLIEKAPPAEYRLRGSGRVVINPDYVAVFEIESPD